MAENDVVIIDSVDKYNEMMKEHNKKYYEGNKEKQSEKNLKRYYYNQECKKFRNILLD